ncbi:shwachman-Bodian-diamond syndrome protein [Aulographum hederae CBS 113979]|uniref:Shwachman-Bodian-diamond syndrome protein n=1 Tax=Aulographum hederae CBS 113979 TaxID=1176131 RepID=A0A6G1H6L4_9PEZI|nr:shwachman-Bodian-diamond syndrome protein [Aulographum hederae CBS 113979]
MTKGDTGMTKVHYKGESDDFVIFAEGVDAIQKWKEDKSTPLVDVVNSFDVFCTHKQGTQGQLDRASKALLENEFGTSRDDDVVKQILEKGDVQEVKGSGRQGDKNPSNGPGVANMGGVHN